MRITFLIAACCAASAVEAADIVFETEAYRFVLGEDACAKSLVVKATGEETLRKDARLPLFAAVQDRPFINENHLAYANKRTAYGAAKAWMDGDRLCVRFATEPYEARFRVKAAAGYLAFTVDRFVASDTDLHQYYGQCLDVPQIRDFRLVQLPAANRAHFGDWLNISWDERAAVAVVGTTPYVACDHRDRDGWRELTAEVGANLGPGLVGATAAVVVGAGREGFLDAMDAFERDYGLCRGAQARRQDGNAASIYWTQDITPGNVDEHIRYAKMGGFRRMLIYYPAMFRESSQCYYYLGNYDWREEYPKGAEDLKAMLAKIRAAGILPGFHTLPPHIGIGSRYVTPVADPRLAKRNRLTLAKDIPAGAEPGEIFVLENPVGSPLTGRAKVRILQFGGELFSYDGYTTAPPYRFTGVKRGYSSTDRVSHARGEAGGVLMVSEYGGRSCHPDYTTDLGVEIGRKIAEIYDCGFGFFYFDGGEGVPPPCEVNVALAKEQTFAQFKTRPPFCEGSAKSHFDWHVQSGNNAFDEFSPEVFKEKIVEYPLREAREAADDLTRVNFGWWVTWRRGMARQKRPTFGIQPDHWEFGISKAVACGAPTTAKFSLLELRSYERVPDLLETIRRWEDVRARKLLSAQDLARVRDPKREFHLHPDGKGGYRLVEWRQLAVAGSRDADVRAFVYDCDGSRYVAYWHIEHRADLVVGGGIGTLKAGRMKLLKSDLDEAALARLFARAKIEYPERAEPRPEHGHRQIMGRDYWTLLHVGTHNDPSFYPNAPRDPALAGLPVFRNSAVRNCSVGPWTPEKLRTPEDFYRTTPGRWEVFARPKKGVPYVCGFAQMRSMEALLGPTPLDKGAFDGWRRATPQIYGFEMLDEWGNDVIEMPRRIATMADKDLKAKLVAAGWPARDPKTRREFLALAEKYIARRAALMNGETADMISTRSIVNIDHIAAAHGAKMLMVEMTDTTGRRYGYRWHTAPMFTRGAARQFGLPWGWYIANYLNGPRADGTWQDESTTWLLPEDARDTPTRLMSPAAGISASLEDRSAYWGYLSGANIVEPENWWTRFLEKDASGREVLSVRGRKFAAYHDFTEAHPDRGVPYAPVAVLMPYDQGYMSYGGPAWRLCAYTPGDYAIDGFFFTLCHGWNRGEMRRLYGEEGCLFNGDFHAMMYDVLTPDSPQSQADFAKVLATYPAAILVGDYHDASVFEKTLADYTRNGGRLFRITPDMLPSVPDAEPWLRIWHGELKAPEIERLIRGLEAEYFPFAVATDCLYGANRTKDGWWLYAFNNAGVQKYADTFEKISPSGDREIVFSLKGVKAAKCVELRSGRNLPIVDNRVRFVVPAGEVAVFEIN